MQKASRSLVCSADGELISIVFKSRRFAVDHQLIAQAGAVAGGIDGTVVLKSAALFGAALGAVGVGIPGIGIGIAASKALEGMARQPEMQGKLLINGIIFAALMEALGLFAFLIALLLFQYGSKLPG